MRAHQSPDEVEGFPQAKSFVSLSVSEAPKEVPVKKYMPSSYYLEEKTDEQKKDEVCVLLYMCVCVCVCWCIYSGEKKYLIHC